MIAALILCALGEIVFTEQPTPGIRVLEVNPLNGQPTLNALQGDINGDGKTDLILDDKIFLQQDGHFELLATPKRLLEGEQATCDVFGGALYVRFEKGLIAYRWNGQRWVTTLDQRIAWPANTLPSNEPTPNALRFERFLHDIDDDHIPEIVLPSENGLHIYTRSKDSYTHAAVLDIFPKPTQLTPPPATLWPPEKRRLHFPTLRTRFRTYIDGDRVYVISKDAPVGDKIQFNWSSYRLDPNARFAVTPAMTRQYRSQPMPAYFQPCNLNNDGSLDFAGTRLSYSHAYPLSTPVLEAAATLDSGASIRPIRSRSFRPLASFIDINGDALLDMIVETTALFDGGIRDILTRALSNRTIDHQVSANFQHRDGTFSEKPDVSARIRIQFEKPPLRDGEMFARYKAGNLINFTGDFNKDGLNDLLIQETSKQLAVYLNKNNHFQRQPDHTLPIPEHWHFGVADLDMDGHSDVLLFPAPSGAPETTPQGKTWFAREASK